MARPTFAVRDERSGMQRRRYGEHRKRNAQPGRDPYHTHHDGHQRRPKKQRAKAERPLQIGGIRRGGRRKDWSFGRPLLRGTATGSPNFQPQSQQYAASAGNGAPQSGQTVGREDGALGSINGRHRSSFLAPDPRPLSPAPYSATRRAKSSAIVRTRRITWPKITPARANATRTIN